MAVSMTAPEQKRLRNIALIAHVDHGKTTLVEAMLRQTGVVRDASTDHMDTLDLEREKGITILAKAASIIWHGVTINLVDTPGHSDFGGEVERALAMVDGVLLLVDASEGPLPQTRYVLRKAMARNLPSVVVLNKVDRKDARAAEVLDEIYQLYIDLGADDHHIEFPVISAVAGEGRSMMGVGMPPESADLSPLLNTVLQTIPPPSGNPNAPLQALVTNLDASDYLGRLAIGRVFDGRLRLERPIAVIGADGNPMQAKLTSLQRFVGLGRDNAGHVDAGDLFILAGISTIEIGDTIADPSEPRALERLHVDEPVLTMTFGPSNSPLSGEGKFRTARATGYALDNLQERGTFFIEPGDDVYEGMVVGENARADDMVVNPTKEKQKTNMRTHASDEAIKLEPPRELTVETAIEFIAADELVEVTPSTLRIRKRILDRRARERAAV